MRLTSIRENEHADWWDVDSGGRAEVTHEMSKLRAAHVAVEDRPE